MRVGIEVGGTFIDLVAVDGESVRTAKVPSTPASPDEGAMRAIDAAGLDPGAIEELVHGSTVATNAVLERKGAVVCLFVTKGIRDVLLLQRHDKDAIHELRYAKPAPIVPRRDVIEVDERVATYGDRFRIGAEGLFGGGPGAKAETYVLRGGQKIPLNSKQQFPLSRGDRLVVRTGGGGGYGPPGERDAALAERDRADGFGSNPGPDAR